jgi:hypothetical protein
MWDTNYLYLLVDVNDDDLRDDDPIEGESWHDDSVEMMIDIANNKNPYPPGYGIDDYQYRVEWKTAELEEYYHGSYDGVDWFVYTKNVGSGEGGRGNGYIVEIAFPWETLDANNTGQTVLNSYMGIEISVNDQDGPGDRDTQIGWHDTTGAAWQNPSVFGTAKLVPCLQAYNPDPSSGETGVLSGQLSWSKGKSAALHHVYFGTNPTPGAAEDRGTQPGTTYNATVGPDTTYYWRIDEVNGLSVWQGNVWNFKTAPLTASNPSPADDAKWITYNTDLSWGAGFYANKHNIYFGTVDPPPVKQMNWSTTSFDVGIMVGGTTYYWAIDEVNTGGTPIWDGPTWSFTTLNAGAGIKAEYYDNATLNGKPDVTRTDYDINFDWGQGAPDPNIPEDNWSVRWTAELELPVNGTYTFTTVRAPISDGVRLYINGQQLISRWATGENPGNEPFEDNADINLNAGLALVVMEFFDTGQAAKAILKWEYPGQAQEVIPRDQYYLPRRSVNPAPPDNAEDVSSNPILGWTPGLYAVTHDLYFGTNEVNVTTASRGSKKGVLIRQDIVSNSDGTSYDLANDVNVGILKFNTAYYWRIDDVNMNTPPNFWSSRIWKFTTDGSHDVETFERYQSPDINEVWKKTVGSGATINTSSKTVFKQIHTGNQAMALSYNNAPSPYYSEVYAKTGGGSYKLRFGKNWRLQDTKALSLWFQGRDLRGSFTGLDPYRIKADGVGMYQTKTDYCYFIYTYVSGQRTGEVIAKVDSMDNTNQWAMAGVMIRQSLADNAKYGAVVVTPSTIVFSTRATDGSTSSVLQSNVVASAPYWVKVGYGGTPGNYRWSGYYAEPNAITGYHDNKWKPESPAPPFVDTPAPVLSNDIYLGVCVTSRSYGEMCNSKISNVSVKSPPTTAKPDPSTGTNIGKAYNDPEKMYVVLKETDGTSATIYYPGTTNPAQADPCATMIGEWTEWRIDLNDYMVAGVDVCDINSMYIGFGNRGAPVAGGSGMVFIDDIALYTAQFFDPKCDDWPPDLARDGSIDNGDLGVIADNWLIYDYNVVPVPPPDPNLVAWYKLEQNTLDFYGTHNGTPNGVKLADYVTPAQEGTYALDLKGDANSVNTASYALSYGIDGNKPRTITVWAKARDFSNNAGVYEIGLQASAREFAFRTTAEPNVWRAQHWGEELNYDIDFTYDSLNKWVNFAHTYDGTTVRVYADGYLVGERAVPLDTATSGVDTRPFSIGWFGDGEGDYYFNGIVDDVRIYNRALSQAQVAYIAGKTTVFTQPLYLLLTPTNPDINLYVDRPGDPPNIINFKDMAELGNEWGNTQVWPLW